MWPVVRKLNLALCLTSSGFTYSTHTVLQTVKNTASESISVVLIWLLWVEEGAVTCRYCIYTAVFFCRSDCQTLTRVLQLM